MRSARFHPRARPPAECWPASDELPWDGDRSWRFSGDVATEFSGHSLRWRAGDLDGERGKGRGWRFFIGCRRCRAVVEHVTLEQLEDLGAYALRASGDLILEFSRDGRTCADVSNHLDAAEVMFT